MKRCKIRHLVRFCFWAAAVSVVNSTAALWVALYRVHVGGQ